MKGSAIEIEDWGTKWNKETALTYLHTPWCRVLLEQLTGLQLVKKFPAFHGTRMFITALTSVRQLSLSWASPIQFTCPHPNSWRSILILSTHLRLGLPSGLLPSGFPTKTLYAPLSSTIRATCPRILPLPYWNRKRLKAEKDLFPVYAVIQTSEPKYSNGYTTVKHIIRENFDSPQV